MLSDMVNVDLVAINLNATTKDALFDELAQLLLINGRISDKALFVADVKQREKDSITCLEGIAYPHAKSKAVIAPGIAIGIKKETIEYGDEDGNEPSVFFMIASPDNGADHHITVLQNLFGKFSDEFIEAMHQAKTAREVIDILNSPDF